MSSHAIGDSLSLLATNTYVGRLCDFGSTSRGPANVDPSLRRIIEATVRATLAAIAQAQAQAQDSDSDSDADSGSGSDAES
jgi:hypothetical protein